MDELWNARMAERLDRQSSKKRDYVNTLRGQLHHEETSLAFHEHHRLPPWTNYGDEKKLKVKAKLSSISGEA